MIISWSKLLDELGISVDSDRILMHAIFKKIFEEYVFEGIFPCL